MLRLLLALAVGAAAAAPAAAAARPGALGSAECSAALPPVLPGGSGERRALLSRLQALLERCLDQPSFLAMLGGLYLDQGQPQEAVLWLERALLLDPEDLGAEADLAMAMAALGQPEPLQALLHAWRTRADVPPALRQRMAQIADPALRYQLPTVQLGIQAPAAPGGAHQTELSVLAGYESNLDRSPRLNELTVTFPGGEIVLPVLDQERKGRAVMLGLGTQWWQGVGQRWMLRWGGNALARFSSSHDSTDWQQYQLALAAGYTGRGWRSQLELAGSWIRGPLGEPFRQHRSTWQFEQDLEPCRLRAGAEVEARTHSRSASLDARYLGALLGLQCSPSGLGTAGLLLRGGHDDPDTQGRPGGAQRIRSLLALWRGGVGEQARLDLSWRITRSQDSEGYSELLENNAVRHMRLHQFSAELGLPAGPPGLDWVLQFQASVQDSNLALFRYRARSAYTGLRQQW